MGWSPGRNKAIVTERDEPGERRFENSEDCRGWPCNQGCRNTRADALTPIRVTDGLRWGRFVVLVIDRNLCLSRTCMQPLDPGPGNSRGKEQHGESHEPATAEDHEHTCKIGAATAV